MCIVTYCCGVVTVVCYVLFVSVSLPVGKVTVFLRWVGPVLASLLVGCWLVEGWEGVLCPVGFFYQDIEDSVGGYVVFIM